MNNPAGWTVAFWFLVVIILAAIASLIEKKRKRDEEKAAESASEYLKDSDYRQFPEGQVSDASGASVFSELEEEAVEYRGYAQELLAGNYIILDTETTGLDKDAQIIELSIIGMDGSVLLDTLIKPKYRMDDSSIATRVHGITNLEVEDAPEWSEVFQKVKEIIDAAEGVVIYNGKFDARLIRQTCRLYGLPEFNYTYYCAMEMFAVWYGQLKNGFSSYRWQKLEFALSVCEARFKGRQHRALSDCFATLDVLRYMADNPPLPRKF